MASDGKLIFDTKIDDSGFKQGLSKIKGLSTSAGKIAAGAIAAVGSSVMALGTAAAKVGSDFEAGMSQVAATMGMTREEINGGSEEFKKLEAAARQMGATTQFSATEASEALNYIALAGYDADDAVKLLPKTLNLAAAGGLELGYATDIVTDAMSALGLSIEDADSFIDQMAKTSQKSNTSVGQLGEAILTVGGTAKDLAGGTVELNTALGILANNGIKGAEGGTKLRNVIMSLTAPTDKAAAAMESLGLTAFDAEGNMRPLNDVFQDLNLKMNDMTTQQKKEWLNTVFNKQDLAAVSALLAANATNLDDVSLALEAAGGPGEEFKGTIAGLAESFDEFVDKEDFVTTATEAFGLTAEQAGILYDGLKSSLEGSEWDSLANEIRNSTGAAEEMSKVMIDNLQGDIKILRSALEELAISFYQTFQGSLRDSVQSATGVIENLSLAFRGIDTQSLKENLENAGLSVDEFEISLVDASFAIEQFSSKAEFVDYATEKWGISVEQAGVLFDELTNSMNNSADSMELVGKAIGGILADSLTELAGQVPKFINIGVDVIHNLVEGLRGNLPEITESGLEIIEALISGILQVIVEVGSLGIDIIANLSEGITQNLPSLMESGSEMILQISEGISDNIPMLTEIAVELIIALAEGLIKATPNLLKAAVEIVVGIVKGITENAPKIVEAVPKLLEELISGIIQAAPSLLKAGAEIVGNIIKGIVTGIPKLLLIGPKIILGIVKGIIEGVVGLVEAGAKIITSLLDGISENLPTLGEIGSSIIEMITTGITGAIGGIFSIGGSLIGKLVEGITGGKEQANAAGTDVANSTVEGFNAGSGGANEAGTSTSSKYSEGILSGKSSAKTAAEEVGKDAAISLDKKDDAGKSGKAMGEAYSKGISENKSNVEKSSKTLSDSAKSGLDKGKTDIGKAGTDSGKEYASKTSEKKSDAEKSGTELGKAAVKGATESSKEMSKSGETAGNEFVKGIKAKAGDATKVGSEISQSLSKGIDSAKSSVTNSVNKLIQESLNAIKNKQNEFQNKGQELIKQLSQGMDRTKTQVDQSIRNILNSALNSSNQFRSQFTNVGSNIARGIASGIRNSSSLVSQAAASAVRNAVSAARKAGQIHSPSRLMANQVGKPLTEGIAMGMTDAENVLIDALSQISDTMLKKMKDSQKNLTYEEQKEISERLKKAKELNISEIGLAYEAYKQVHFQNIKDIEEQIKTVEDEIAKSKKDKKSEARIKELEEDKKLLEEKKKFLKDYSDDFSKTYENIVKEYESAIEKIKNDSESLKNKLLAYGDVIEVVRDAEGNVIKDNNGNEMLKLSDLNAQIAQVATYGNLLDELERRGADVDVMSKMLTMSVDDAVKYGQLLMQQSDADWNIYMNNMEKKRKLAEGISTKYFQKQLQNVDKEYKEKLIQNLGKIPDETGKIGKNAAEEMAKGFKNNTNPFLQAVDQLLNQMKQRLNSEMQVAISNAQSNLNMNISNMQAQAQAAASNYNITVNGADYNNRSQAFDYGRDIFEQVERERRRYGR
ncbi:MAG: phage tail tape measure protein [Prevotellaceae bacterium]|nr:phage tail tape measure protein [Prevotellaceae bacterium]